MKSLIQEGKKSYFRWILNTVFILFIIFLWYKDVSTSIKKYEIESVRLEELHKKQDSVLIETGKTIFLLKAKQEELISVQDQITEKIVLLTETKQNIINKHEEENIIIDNANYDELGRRLCSAIIFAVNADLSIGR